MSDWVACANQLPEAGRVVMLVYLNALGKRRIVIAHHMDAFVQESSPESDLDIEYHEERDAYYDPAGWYVHCEWHPDYAYWLLSIDEEPTHWKPLPELPA